MPGVVKGLEAALLSGADGWPMTGFRAVLTDGAFHPVDSSPGAFERAAREAATEAFAKAGTILLEPVMLTEVRVPDEHVGAVVGDLGARRGTVLASEAEAGAHLIKVRVPLARMFGYVGDLRSLTRGRRSFAMVFDAYAKVPDAEAAGLRERT